MDRSSSVSPGRRPQIPNRGPLIMVPDPSSQPECTCGYSCSCSICTCTEAPSSPSAGEDGTQSRPREPEPVECPLRSSSEPPVHGNRRRAPGQRTMDHSHLRNPVYTFDGPSDGHPHQNQALGAEPERLNPHLADRSPVDDQIGSPSSMHNEPSISEVESLEASYGSLCSRDEPMERMLIGMEMHDASPEHDRVLPNYVPAYAPLAVPQTVIVHGIPSPTPTDVSNDFTGYPPEIDPQDMMMVDEEHHDW